MNNIAEIRAFADKWIAKFKDPNINFVELVDHYFYDDCRALGFMMEFEDDYCCEKYGKEAHLSCHHIEDYFKVTDPFFIGSALLTEWRYYNHWAYDAKAILKPEKRCWFVAWLMRLKDLSEKANKGEAKTMKYPQFGQIIETMETANFDYKKDWTGTIPKDFYTLKDHISGMVYAQLSNQRPWKPIADHFAEIDAIFHDFDPMYLKNADPAELEAQIRAIHCGNRQIHKQMLSLKENIEMLERINRENGSIDLYYRGTKKYDLVQSLSYGKYKLKQMGAALVSEYLKNRGIDLIKPDTHVLRILGRLGLTEHSPATVEEAFDVCHEIAVEYGMRDAEVDSVLWQFGADGFFELCTSAPKCEKCLVKDCKERK